MKIHRLPKFTALLASSMALALALAWIAPSAAQAQEDPALQCLSREECQQLRETLRAYRQEIRPLRRQLRSLLQEIRELDPDDPRRPELIEQARALRQEIRELRRERRPFVRRFRTGCRRQCFED